MSELEKRDPKQGKLTRYHPVAVFVLGMITLPALVLVGMAALGNITFDSRQALIATLSKQADAWDKAIVRQDQAAIAANMADDFRQIDHEGNTADKVAFLKAIMSPKLHIDPYTVDGLDVRVYNNTALLSGRTRMTGTYDGKPFTAHYRYTDVYVRNKNTWRVVSVQISPMPL